MSAATLDQLHDERDAPRASRYRAALALNLVLNGGWSWVFFNRRQLGAAAALAAVLTASSADLARRTVAVRGAAGVPLVLYPLWCAFATALSTHIRLLNPRA